MCLKRNSWLKRRYRQQFGGKISRYAFLEQWAIGGIDRATNRVILAMLPGGGRKNINSETVTDIFLAKTARRHTLICTDGAKYYDVSRFSVHELSLKLVKVIHRKHERVQPVLRTVGGQRVGTQRYVVLVFVIVCVCVCVSVCACWHASVKLS